MSGKWLCIGDHTDGLPVQVVPENDLREHCQDPNGLCPCMPRVLDGRVIHNAYDARETGEVCRRALDALAKALPDGHQWTDEERDHYDHAIHVLNMHWPAP